MKEEKIAALDCDWAEFTPAEQAAYALARKLTYEPQSIAKADIDALRKHYKDLQILEMIISVSGNNSTNRWKDGVGSPQSREGGNFAKKSKDPPASGPTPRESPAVLKSFLTPTAEKYKTTVTRVAPLQVDEKSGAPSRLTVCSRPPLESRAAVEKALEECRKRTPRLPLVDEAQARALLPEDWSEGPLPQWVRLLANFPVDGKSRIAGFRSAEIKGDLKPLFKAQLSWIIARQDRAWYAVGLAHQRLKELGCSEDQIYQLDGAWQRFTPAERALFTVARNLAASPIVLNDDDVARAVELAGPRDVVQVISHTTSRSCFNRITEAAGLQLEPVAPGAQKKAHLHVPVLDNATAWKHLPAPDMGAGQPLPAWARATAEALPRTTAAMLELDYLHRAGSPLDARLRGMMRWSAAHANRCAFTETQALADLRLAGVEVAVIDTLTTDPKRLSAAEQADIEFARKLTSAAYTVTDEEMAQLIKTHGEKQVVAMVQLLAYANFQDRLIHALGVAKEEPLSPLQVVFVPKKTADSTLAPPRKIPSPPPGPAPASRITDPEWLAFDFDELQKRMVGQWAREPRIRVPTSEELNKQNPDAPPRKIGIRWSLVCSGYQPKLAQGWSSCTRAFGEEAQQSRAFEELQFWVVTRSLNCFY